MQVAFDPQAFLRQRTGGISRAFVELIAAFDSDPGLGVSTITSFKWINNQYAADALSSHGFKKTPDWIPRALAYAAHTMSASRFQAEADLIHHTHYGRPFLVPVRIPRVSTIHDMIPEILRGKEGFTSNHAAKSAYVSRSDLIVCVSESTRSDLEYYLGPVRGEVRVVHNPVSSSFRPGLPRCMGLPKEYVLYVGKRAGYKDFRTLPVAIKRLRDKGLDCSVVVVGPPFSHNERRFLEEMKVYDLFHFRGLTDQQLRSAYSNALLTVQTSTYEGFGLTPIESMASGTPVVVTNASAMPEICGNAAVYYQASNSEHLAEQMEKLLIDERLRSLLVARGLKRSDAFGPEAIALRMKEAYEIVLN